MTGNDPLNDPENFDWEGWEDDQIADFERKQRATETVRNRMSWRGVNERGALWGVYQAGRNAYVVEIVQPPADVTLPDRRFVLINGEKVGEAPGIRAAANLAIRHFVDRPSLCAVALLAGESSRSQVSETSEGEVMLNTRAIDQDRLDHVLERLAVRRDRVDGDYYHLFNDRWLEARRWKADLATGSGVLTLDRRNSLLEFERIADPELGNPPYRIAAADAKGRQRQTFLRIVPGGEGFVVAAIGDTSETAPYSQISEQSWKTRQAAEQTLHRDAWSIKEPAQQVRRTRK